MNLVMSLASMPPPPQEVPKDKIEVPSPKVNQESQAVAALDIDLEKISKDHEDEIKRLQEAESKEIKPTLPLEKPASLPDANSNKQPVEATKPRVISSVLDQLFDNLGVSTS